MKKAPRTTKDARATLRSIARANARARSVLSELRRSRRKPLATQIALAEKLADVLLVVACRRTRLAFERAGVSRGR